MLPSGAGGELQTYQIRTATASSSLPQTVVTNSPVGLSQLKLDDPTVKREIRLAKNRQAPASSPRPSVAPGETRSRESLFSLPFFQRGRPRVSAEEEGVRQMPGKPRSRSGKPKQDSDRRAENFKGPLLRQDGMSRRRAGWWDDGSGSAART